MLVDEAAKRRSFFINLLLFRDRSSSPRGPNSVYVYILVSYIDDLGITRSLGRRYIDSGSSAVWTSHYAYIWPHGSDGGRRRGRATTGSRIAQTRRSYSYRRSARRALSSGPLSVVIVTRPDGSVGCATPRSSSPPVLRPS